MKRLESFQQHSEEAVRLSKRLTPEERLVAFFNHSRLISQIYQAGVRYRSRSRRKPS